jgi:hypothetical protein
MLLREGGRREEEEEEEEQGIYGDSKEMMIRLDD